MNPVKAAVAVLPLFFALVLAQRYERCEFDEHLTDPPECPEYEGYPTYFPVPYDCRKFFECTNGDAKCIQCPIGTVWDQDLKVCNHEGVTPCVIITTTSKPLPTTTTTATTTIATTTTPTTTTPTTTTPTTTTTTTEPPPTTTEDPANWICPEGYLGPIGHPFICTQFYICDPARRPCLFDCQNGLYYNPELQICDWPHNVPSCRDGTPPPPTPGTVPNYRVAPRGSSSVLVERSNDGDDRCEESLIRKFYKRVV